MLNFLAVNPFTDSSSPWYYVVGVIFLVLIFAALAVYVVVSGKRKKKRESENTSAEGEQLQPTESDEEKEPEEGERDPEQPVENGTETAVGSIEDPEQVEETRCEQTVAEIEAEPEVPKEIEKKVESPERDEPQTDAPQAEITDSEVQTEQKTEKAEEKPQKKPETKKPKTAAQPQKAEKAEQSEKIAKQPAKQTKPKAQKTFIDRLIADKSVHGVYNAVKNVILSYPGMKAKITKEDEQFRFGEQIKASIALESSGIVLKLAIDPNNVPSQFKVTKSGGELPVAMHVSETDIDSAGKLIMFAMNVALLTRNERHRYTDYIRNAISAKNKAKKK